MAFGRQSALVVGNSFLGAAQGFVALFAIARYMGDELLGGRAFALSLVYLVGIVCRLGFPITHARRLARGDDVAASNGAYLWLKVVLTGGFALLGGLAGYLWFVALDKPATDTTDTALLLAFLIVIAQSLRDVPVNSFRGLRHILYREAVLFTNTAATALLTLWVAVAYAVSRGRWVPLEFITRPATELLGVTGPMSFGAALNGLMLAFFIAEVAALVLAVLFFVRLRIPIGRPTRPIVMDYLVATLPLMLLSVSAMLTKRVSQVMLGFWWDASELGQFAGAAKLSEVLLLLASGVTIVLLPAVSRMDARGETERLRLLVVEAERWISLLAWPAVVFVALAARPILHITLSDAFLGASFTLTILCLHTLVASLRMPLQTKALGLGQHQFAARVALASVLVNIALNLALIPEQLVGVTMAGLGAEGAALAALGSGFVPLFAYRTKAREWTGHPFFSIHLRKHLAAAAATYGAFALLPQLPVLIRVWQLAAYGAAVLAVYLVLLVLLRELGRRDLAWARVVLGQTPKASTEVAPP